jgi:hypothetical protein
VYTIVDTEKILQTYELSEIIEYNELTEADVLLFCLEEEFLKMPEINPL